MWIEKMIRFEGLKSICICHVWVVLPYCFGNTGKAWPPYLQCMWQRLLSEMTAANNIKTPELKSKHSGSSWYIGEWQIHINRCCFTEKISLRITFRLFE